MTATGWNQSRRLWLLLLPVGAVIGALVVLQPALAPYAVLGMVALAPVLVLVFRAPEILFALYMSIGSFKAGLLPLQQRLGIDLTIVMAVLVIASIALRVLRGQDRPHLHWPLLAVYLLLVGWVCFSVAWSPETAYGLEKSARFATLTLLAFAAPMLLLDTWSRLERFFWALFLAGVAFTAVALVSLYLGGQVRRLVTVFGADYLTLGRICGPAAGLGAYFLVGRAKTWWSRLALLVCVGAAIAAMFLGGARGPLVAWALGFAFPMLVGKHRGKELLWVLGGILIAVILFWGAWRLGYLPPDVTYRFELLYAAFVLRLPYAVRWVPRIHIWQVAVETFLQHPVLGVGVRGYWTTVPGGGVFYPHNLFLEAGAELGLTGLMLVLFLVGFPLLRWRRCSGLPLPSRNRLLFNMALFVYTFFFIEAMKSGDFNGNRTFWMGIGLVMSACTLAIAELCSTASTTDERVHQLQ